MDKITDWFSTQILALTSSVAAVSEALSMHLNEMSDAYSGRCPDHSTDVNPLDLDTNYVVMLDALRQTRPESYQLLLGWVLAWQKATPVLYKQAVVMGKLAALLTSKMTDSSGSCPVEVAAAVAASLSTANHPPQSDPDASDVQDESNADDSTDG